MSRIGKLITDLARLDREIAALEDQTNKLKAKRYIIATQELPEEMIEYGSSTWDDGRFSCRIESKIYGNIPQEENLRAAAINYIVELGEEGIISADLKASFGKGDMKFANKMKRVLQFQLDAAEREDPIDVKANVHVMTLQALARRRVKDNLPIRLDVLGLRSQTMAFVKEHTK